MSDHFDFVSRIGGLFVAAAVAPVSAALVYSGLVFLMEPSLEGVVVIPAMALFSLPFGFVGAFLFGAAGVLIVESFALERWLLPAVGAATGIAHSMFALVYGPIEPFVEWGWITGAILAALASETPGGHLFLFIATGVGGMMGGRVYRAIVVRVGPEEIPRESRT